MERSPKKIVLWGAWYGSRNVGDQVLLLTISDILKDVLGDVHLTVLTNNAEHIQSYTSRESACKIKAINSRKQFLEVVKEIASSDIFILGGGVPFYAEWDHVLVMVVLISIAKLFRIPYMTWTVSSQVVNNPWVKRLFGWILNSAQVITYRDDFTRELFESCGVKRPMVHTIDSGFYLEASNQMIAQEMIARSGKRDLNRPLVGLTPRKLSGRDGDAQTHYNVKTQEEYQLEISCFSAAVDWLWENGYQPIFIPMNTVAPDDDRLACLSIIAQARYGSNVMLIDEEVRPRVAPVLYRECCVSFVARVHGSITSMVGNCPVMMYSFAPKHTGIMKSMGLADYVIEERSADPESTIKLLKRILDNESNLRKFMDEKLLSLKGDAQTPALYVAQIVGSVPKEQK